MIEPFLLKPTFAERVWGRTDLRPWYSETGTKEKVGEAWLTGPKSLVASGEFAGQTLEEVAPRITGGGEFPLLVKMLFPNDKLSVQVHPDDVQAQASGLARGKTECWYVLEAEPGATVACGLQAGVTIKEVADAIAEGKLETLMKFLPVQAGDMVFVDAGTVHAIGPGVTLLEVQQTSDVTYRLYDYGRPRELHLEAGLAVVKTETAAGLVQPKAMSGFTRLIEEKYFVVDRYEIAGGGSTEITCTSAGCAVSLAGEGEVGGVKINAGEAVVVPEGTATVASEHGLSFAWCRQPDLA